MSDDRCVLVVDDDPVIRQFVRAVLEGVGLRVEEAAAGEEALARIDTLSPEVVILDVMMPGVGGLDVLRRIDATTVKVLMLTALDDAATKATSARAGARAYLTKPFSPSELLDRVESLLAP